MDTTHLDSLNPAQRRAVEATEGPVLIIAGAGSGKTKTLTTRCLHIAKKGVDPQHILGITFTNKAAKEMRERFLSLYTPEYPGDIPFLGTFHSLGVYILQNEHRLIDRPKHFKILDRDETKTLLKEAMRAHGYDPKVLDVNRVLSVLSRKKSSMVTVSRFSDTLHGETYDRHFSEAVAEVWHGYENLLEEQGALDFDDLLLKTAILLRGNKEVREKYQNLWHYIHIDEYQDTNAVQYEIGKLLAGERKNICAVGDADQSIYSWRGADITNILNFEKDFRDTQTIKLETNYRSTKRILGAAQDVIKNNSERIPKKLETNNEEGEHIVLHTATSESDEASYVAEEVNTLIEEGIDPQEIAILYRTNFQSRALEEAFLMRHIPYQLLGTKFFDRKEVKDILAYISLALNPKSMSDLTRAINTPTRGIGKVSLLKILEGHESDLTGKAKNAYEEFKKILEDIREKIHTLPPSELVMHIFEISGLRDSFENLHEDEQEERTLNVAELATLAGRYDHLPPEENINAFLTDAALTSDQDSLDEKKPAVRLMTVHASKGLEFDVVFVVGLEEGLFPHTTHDDSKRDLEEERRLFYVAITRAKKKLYLTHALMRRVFGTTDIRAISSFVDEIDKKHIEYKAEDISTGDLQRKKGIADIFDIEF